MITNDYKVTLIKVQEIEKKRRGNLVGHLLVRASDFLLIRKRRKVNVRTENERGKKTMSAQEAPWILSKENFD